jgi:hypothetical protein
MRYNASIAHVTLSSLLLLLCSAALQFNQAKAKNLQESLKRVMQANTATKLKHAVSTTYPFLCVIFTTCARVIAGQHDVIGVTAERVTQSSKLAQLSLLHLVRARQDCQHCCFALGCRCSCCCCCCCCCRATVGVAHCLAGPTQHAS